MKSFILDWFSSNCHSIPLHFASSLTSSVFVIILKDCHFLLVVDSVAGVVERISWSRVVPPVQCPSLNVVISWLRDEASLITHWQQQTSNIKQEWSNIVFALINKKQTRNVRRRFPKRWLNFPFYALRGRF